MAVEARTRPTIRRHRTEDHRLPLPTRHKQMEQDRTPALLSHYRQLAWPAAGELPNRRQPYRQHHNLDRPRRRMRARPEHLPDKDQAHQAAEERDTHQTTRVPRGMELYHPTAMRTGCFIPAPTCPTRIPRATTRCSSRSSSVWQTSSAMANWVSVRRPGTPNGRISPRRLSGWPPARQRRNPSAIARLAQFHSAPTPETQFSGEVTTTTVAPTWTEASSRSR